MPAMIRTSTTTANAAGMTWSVVTALLLRRDTGRPRLDDEGKPFLTDDTDMFARSRSPYRPADLAVHSSPAAYTTPSGASDRLTTASLPAGTMLEPPAPYAPTKARLSPPDPHDRHEHERHEPAVTPAMTKMSGAATVTSGAVGDPGAVYSANAPSTKQMSPPTASRP